MVGAIDDHRSSAVRKQRQPSSWRPAKGIMHDRSCVESPGYRDVYAV